MSEHIAAEEVVLVTVKTQNLGDVELICPTSATIEYVKKYVSEEVKSHRSRNFRLLYKGKERSGSQTLCEIEPEINPDTNIQIFAVESPVEKTAAFTKVNNVRILQRNVDECVKCAIEGINPRERTRYNDPVTLTTPQPTARYLANIFTELGGTMEKMSENMMEMAEFLKADQTLSSEEVYETKRRMVQNNMDTVRYANPMLMNLTKLKVPLNDPNALLQLTES